MKMVQSPCFDDVLLLNSLFEGNPINITRYTALSRYADYGVVATSLKMLDNGCLEFIKPNFDAFYARLRNKPPCSTARQGLQVQGYSCPLCGSMGLGTIDHFLPRSKYPEYAFYSWNVVPCCFICNTTLKRDRVGFSSDKRFLHPYIDSVLDLPLWKARFISPYEAPLIEVDVLVNDVNKRFHKSVDFHVRSLLGDQFFTYADRRLPTIGETIYLDHENKASIGDVDIAWTLNRLYRDDYIETKSHNSWSCGFLRGLLDDLGFARASLESYMSCMMS